MSSSFIFTMMNGFFISEKQVRLLQEPFHFLNKKSRMERLKQWLSLISLRRLSFEIMAVFQLFSTIKDSLLRYV